MFLTIFVKQDVVRLDISVQYHLPVHDVNSSEHLLHHKLYSFKRDCLLLLHEELAQGGVAILEDTENDLVFVALILDDIENLHKIRLVTETF